MQLEQDDPCVVKVIREKFLFPPSNEPLNVQSPADKDPSAGQAQIVRELNKNQVFVLPLIIIYHNSIEIVFKIQRNKVFLWNVALWMVKPVRIRCTWKGIWGGRVC